MCRALVVCAGFALILTSPGAPQNAELKQALAIEKSAQKAIAENEATVACVLVSRSELYARFGQGASAENPGKLGAFDRDAIQKDSLFAELPAGDRKRVLQQLEMADQATVPQSWGCGFVVDQSGLVLTPYHVVEGATKIYIRLSGNRGGYADIHAADPRSDLAILRLLKTKNNMPVVRIAEGVNAERGQFVVGLAFPFSTELTLSKPSALWGIISSVRERPSPGNEEEGKIKTLQQYGSLLLTDTRVNLGTSGGVLLNLKGEAIGLTSTMAGIGGSEVGSLAIPLTPALRRIIEVLKRGEEVEYGFLGVSLERGKSKSAGALLASVTDGSPADLAGLKEGQIIVSVNGQAVADSDELLAALAVQLAGNKVQLDVRKPGNTALVKLNVVLAKYFVAGKAIASTIGNRPFFRGMRVDDTSLLVQQPLFTGGGIPRGVLVSEVREDSAADKAELKSGLVITHVNDRAVINPAAFYDIVLQQKGPVQLTLQAQESGRPAPKVVLP